MGLQIEKRKKKGRPSKADLAARLHSTPRRDIRRSSRRSNVRYDYDDDYWDEEEEEEEDEVVRRREKKVKLVGKLHSNENARSSGARELQSEDEEEEDEVEEERGKIKSRKRKINRDVEDDDDDADYDSDDAEESDVNGDDDEDDEVKLEKEGNIEKDPLPGTPQEAVSSLPLPDKKTLELVLDKLQKKDIYGVYAEPVDLDELPDYLDYIDNPMDFSTVRKKLANGSYSTLEQLKDDVLLICSNAMQYNSSDTVYYKQARTIEELATKKFQRLRDKLGRVEKEMKSAQMAKSDFLSKKQIKKPLCRSLKEPVDFDLSSGPTPTTTGDIQSGSATNQINGFERPVLTLTDGPQEGNYSLVDNNLEKMEDVSSSGKGLLSKLGRKPSIVEENHRASYSISNQPALKSESIFTTFEGEVKQLVAVGLHAEYAYARSLAHFAANLGPTAWKIASQKVEQSLPAGFKFGRGWVGEYEPLPTSVLIVEPQIGKDPPFFSKLQTATNDQVANVTSKPPGLSKEHFVPVEEEIMGTGKQNRATKPVKKNNSVLSPCSNRKPLLSGGKQSVSASVGATYLPFRKHGDRAIKQVELNLPPTANQHDADIITDKKLSNSSEMAVLRNLNLPQAFKQPDYNNGVGFGKLANGGETSGRNKLLNGRTVNCSVDVVPRQITSMTPFTAKPSNHQPDYSNGVGFGKSANAEASSNNNNGNGRNSSVDTVHHQITSMTHFPARQSNSHCFEKAPNEETSGNDKHLNGRIISSSIDHQNTRMPQYTARPSNHQPADSQPVTAVRNDSTNASSTAARAWMAIGAGAFKQPPPENLRKIQISADSLYNNPTWKFHPHSPQAQGNTFQFQQSLPQSFHNPNETRFLNRPTNPPQLVTTDFSRLNSQSSWHGLSPHSQPRPKQGILPPDLNIDFQLPNSPVKQSSNGMMDSQHPDLALQL